MTEVDKNHHQCALTRAVRQTCVQCAPGGFLPLSRAHNCSLGVSMLHHRWGQVETPWMHCSWRCFHATPDYWTPSWPLIAPNVEILYTSSVFARPKAHAIDQPTPLCLRVATNYDTLKCIREQPQPLPECLHGKLPPPRHMGNAFLSL